jgi:shikimate dehydrogenase
MPDLFVLLGHPVAHSLSPVMHRAAFRARSISATYVALDVTDFEAGWTAVRRLGIRGGNVTVPWKAAAAAALDAASEASRSLNSANTFWRTGGGTLAGTETDGEGFVRAIAEAFDLSPKDLRVAVLGAGGAGRAVASALAEAGAARLYLWNRTRARAESLAARLLERGVEVGVSLLDEGPLGPRLPAGAVVDLVVNATSLGLRRPAPPLADPSDFPGTAHAMDLVYGREPSAFLRAFEAAGARTSDGLAMLLHQGARAFELWFDEPAPLEIMRSALADALGRGA